MIISIDPGKHQIAYAAWNAGDFNTLYEAGAISNPAKAIAKIERVEAWARMAEQVCASFGVRKIFPSQLVTEIPAVRQRGSGKGDPNDLIDLAGIVGAIVGGLRVKFPESVVKWSPLPEQWKGQLPKSVTKDRVDAALSDFEKTRIQWSGEKHNIYDAIHLGLVYLHKVGLR